MITKSHNHFFFFVEDGILYEVYRTLRGERHRAILEVPGTEDTEHVTDSDIEMLQKKYISEK